jgi:P-type Mg2+ transporter
MTQPSTTQPPTTTQPSPILLRDSALWDVAQVLKELETASLGLSTEEANLRRSRYGPNVLAAHRVTAFDVLARQLRNPLLLLLVAAAALSAATGAKTDGVIIGAIVALSVGLGFVNEFRSEQAVGALQANIHHQCVVLRDGAEHLLEVDQVVPGDIVTLRVGALVPADIRIIEANQLTCDEAVLTGESQASPKHAELQQDLRVPGSDEASLDLNNQPTSPNEISLLAMSNCAFMGTVVRQGSGRGVVVATGSATEFGKIALGLSSDDIQTGFQKGLSEFSKLLVGVAGVLTVSIFIVNVAFSRPLMQALLFSLAIAIGISPQLLPAIVSVSLASGSRKLAKQQVLVKRLVTIEDLGNIEVLFTDKTGTLTEGTISFNRALDPNGQPLESLIGLGLACNEATMTDAGPVGGNTLDCALWTAAPTTQWSSKDPSDGELSLRGSKRIDILPFDHERQLATVLVRSATGTVHLVTKGAPEAVFARCHTVPANAAAVLQNLFAEGARVVAVATRDVAPTTTTLSIQDEHDLSLAGFLTFVDKPKANVGLAVAKLQQLGVTVKIITGDNGTVASKVCRDIGIIVEGVLTGNDIEALDDDGLVSVLATTTVFSRISPEQKARIVRTARRSGAEVAFLGDGVNDALALHAADVGISVDSATDVAKDAADIVLLDKDLGVLADGIMEGRRIFANTLKYVLMATSSNFGNMVSAAGASLFLSFLPMLPPQILLNNLLYDVGQLAIPGDRVDPEILSRPASWDIHFVRRFMSVFGPISSLFDFVTFFVLLRVLHADQEEFRSGWFVESLATQTLVVFLIRTRRVPFFRSKPSLAIMVVPSLCALVGLVLPFSPFSKSLGFTPLPLRFFLILGAMSVVYLCLIELAKSRFYAIPHRAKSAPQTAHKRRHRRIARRARHFNYHPVVRRPPMIRRGSVANRRSRH